MRTYIKDAGCTLREPKIAPTAYILVEEGVPNVGLLVLSAGRYFRGARRAYAFTPRRVH